MMLVDCFSEWSRPAGSRLAAIGLRINKFVGKVDIRTATDAHRLPPNRSLTAVGLLAVRISF